jgi:ketosteroid isomerase-like protein
LAAGALLAALAIPKAQPQSQPLAADDATVLAADTALGAAMRLGDKAAARRLLALQFTFVDANGKIHTRKDVVADLRSVAAAAASDAKVRLYGFIAAVTGHRQSAGNTDVFFLDIWARQKGAWRALMVQDISVATNARVAAAAGATGAAAPVTDAQPYDCKNPCQTVPYRIRSSAEQDVVTTFQAIMKAIVARDASEWGKHVAEEFVVYRAGQTPLAKSERIAAIERQKEGDTTVSVGEVQAMRVAVYGDGAVMTATDALPDNSRAPVRTTRVWVKRNGQWLLAISAHTDVK